jgi:flagellar M-ring protein FliF
VVARVTASVDASEVSSQNEQIDPDATALKSERRVSSSQSQDSSSVQGVAGAAANQPLQPQATGAGPTNRGSSAMQDEVKNYEISRTTTHTVNRVPRIKRLSVAVLVDGVGGKPRADAEVQRLGELARRAVGFDSARGDVFDISSAPFARSEESTVAPAKPEAVVPRTWLYAGGAAAAVIVLLLVTLLGRGRGGSAGLSHALPVGARIAEIEAGLAAAAPALAPVPGVPQLSDPSLALRDRARDLAAKDPSRAAHILKAWMQNDQAQRNPNG